MSKKIVLCILFIISIFVFSCTKNTNTDSNTPEIAVIIDLGSINDRSFNQGSWEGVKSYAEKHNIGYKYYRVSDKRDMDSYLNAIDTAVKDGAKLVVTPSYMFEPVIYKAQDIYTNIHFILIDGQPQDGTYSNYKTSINTSAILYAEEEAGFLAGYAIVKEGYTNLGVMGGIDIAPVIRFSYGFVQGAEYAATEMGLPLGLVKINYTYLGNFNAAPENQELASSWYKSGIQVIFAPAGGAANSVMRAAEENNALVVGVDSDQSFESPTVITSAMKLIRESVYNSVASFYNGTFNGGRTIILNAKLNGIGLPMSASKFKVFTKDDYDIIYNTLVNRTIKIYKDTDVKTAEELPLDMVTINYIK